MDEDEAESGTGAVGNDPGGLGAEDEGCEANGVPAVPIPEAWESAAARCNWPLS